MLCTSLDIPLDGFGVDSLLAVEIRTWWLKNLQVNVIVMKILSGVTVRNIIECRECEDRRRPRNNPTSRFDGYHNLVLSTDKLGARFLASERISEPGLTQ
jgi:hypothetical protein